MSNYVTILTRPSEAVLTVRLDWPNPTYAELCAVGEAIDFFAYTLCETCGYGHGDHVVTRDPFGKPFLYCEKGDQ